MKRRRLHCIYRRPFEAADVERAEPCEQEPPDRPETGNLVLTQLQTFDSTAAKTSAVGAVGAAVTDAAAAAADGRTMVTLRPRHNPSDWSIPDTPFTQ